MARVKQKRLPEGSLFLTNIKPINDSIVSAFLDVIPFLEAVNSSCSINKFLLAGKERVTGRTNFNVDVLCC